MNLQNIAQDLAKDYLGNVDIDEKYKFELDMWQKIYKTYIQFPSLKSNSGSYYACNELVVSELMSEFKSNLTKVEHLLDDRYFQFNFTSDAYLEILKYQVIGSSYDENDYPNFNESLTDNLQAAKTFIELNEITLENITELFKVVSKGIIDFHPVQGINMYRAVDLAIYNQFDRLILTCVDFVQIDQQMHDIIELCNLNNRRDEYANFLLAQVLKAHFLRISPFYRYNELMAELLVVWFNLKQEFNLPYVVHNNLFKLDYLEFYSGLEKLRFSPRQRDITFWIKNQITMINRHLQAFAFIKVASDISIEELDLLTMRERDYLMIIICSHLKEQFFNWEMLNDELKRSEIDSTKAGVLKILNRLVMKDLLIAKTVGKSKLFKINL